MRIRLVYPHYGRKVNIVREWWREEWWEWAYVDNKPIRFNRMDPQPPAYVKDAGPIGPEWTKERIEAMLAYRPGKGNN